MHRIYFRIIAVVCAASLALGSALLFPAFAAAEILGQHVVQKGETLYCIGRGYGVVPSAIAEANGLSAFAFLSLGQVLKIPAVQWSPVPPGPVCARQFTSPFTGGAAVTLTPTPTPPTATPTPPATSGTTYTVKRGDTLFRIGLRFGVTWQALKTANDLPGIIIYPGQVLVVPSGCPNGCITPPSSCVIKGNVSIDTSEKIYHVPGGAFYDETIIRPDFGERWFCTEAEAIANGWRKSER